MDTNKISVPKKVCTYVTILAIGLCLSAFTPFADPISTQLPQVAANSSPVPSQPGGNTNLSLDIDQWFNSLTHLLSNDLRIDQDIFKPNLIKDVNQTLDQAARDNLVSRSQATRIGNEVDNNIRKGDGVFSILGKDNMGLENNLLTQNARLKVTLGREAQKISNDVSQDLGIRSPGLLDIVQTSRSILGQVGAWVIKIAVQIDQFLRQNLSSIFLNNGGTLA
jgi:hypothetical protein